MANWVAKGARAINGIRYLILIVYKLVKQCALSSVWSEQFTHNEKVVSSILAGRTRENDKLYKHILLYYRESYQASLDTKKLSGNVCRKYSEGNSLCRMS